eukprot:6455056-Alexandrium_andersonii.AAC.1
MEPEQASRKAPPKALTPIRGSRGTRIPDGAWGIGFSTAHGPDSQGGPGARRGRRCQGGLGFRSGQGAPGSP